MRLIPNPQFKPYLIVIKTASSVRLAAILLLAGLLLTGIGNIAGAASDQNQKLIPLDRIVAIINNNAITWRQLQQRIREIRAELETRGTPLPPEPTLERRVLKSMILNQVQLGIASYMGVSISPVVLNDALAEVAHNNSLTVDQLHQRLTAEGFIWSAFVNQLRDRLITTRLQQQMVDKKIHITNREVNEFLARYANRIDPGQQYHLTQILIPIPSSASPEQLRKAYTKAEKLRQQALHGASFTKLAIAYSAGQHALKGGDLGWISAMDMPRYILQAVNVMKPRQISQPLRSPSGYHLIKLRGTRGGAKITVTQTHVRQILIKITPTTNSTQARAKLERLRQDIKMGTRFTHLAKAYSQAIHSASNGGDMSWVSPGTHTPEFDRIMQETLVNQVSQPFQTPSGWHIIEVLGHRVRNTTGAMVHSRAKEILFLRKRQEALNVWLRKIREQAYVHILLTQPKTIKNALTSTAN